MRLFHLGRQSLWLDEASTAAYVTKGWAQALYSEVHHPPGYYAFLHIWAGAFGSSETSLRLPSAVFGTLSLIFVFLLARRFFPERPNVAPVAALAAAVSPYLVYIAQEARSYALLVLLSLAATTTLWDWLEPRRGGEGDRSLLLALYSVLAALLLYTHYFGVWVLLAHELWALGYLRRLGKPARSRTMGAWFLSRAATAGLFAPWAFYVLRHQPGPAIHWMRSPWVMVPYAVLRYLVGYGVAPPRRALLTEPVGQLLQEEGLAVAAALLPLLVLSAYGLWVWLHERPTGPVPPRWLLGSLLILPWVALLALSPWRNLMHDRALGFQSAIVLFAAARGMDALAPSKQRVAAAITASGMAFALAVQYAGAGTLLLGGYAVRSGKEQWREAAEAVARAGAEAVVFVPGYAAIGYDYYEKNWARARIDGADRVRMAELGAYRRVALVRSNDADAARDEALRALAATHEVVGEAYFPNQVGIHVTIWAAR